MVIACASGGMVICGSIGVAVGGHHVAVAIQVKRAGARVGEFARRAPHLEEALALNDHIQRIVGLREVALREDDFVRRGARAETELQAGRNHGLLAGGRPGCIMLWYSRSWNCARRILKPAVLALARLWAMLSTFICCAVMPLAALYSARIMNSPSQTDFGDFFDRACRFISAPSVTAFCSISNCRITLTSRTAASALPVLDASSLPCSTVVPDGVRGRDRRVGDREIIVALLGESRGAGEVGDLELADDAYLLRHGAVGRNFDWRGRSAESRRAPALRTA